MALDLNCDMGEGFGRYRLGLDHQVMPYITSANLACGFHAADPLVMEQTVRLAAQHGVAVGAHPGYPDLRGFGRRHLECSPQEVRADVLYQIGALAAICRAAGQPLTHVKPHGALYNRAASHEPTARALAQAVAQFDSNLVLVTLAGPGGQVCRQAAEEQGLAWAAEAFADRAYTPAGHLVPRDQEGAVIHDPEQVAARCLRLARQGVVEAIDQSLVELNPHTICLHGDTPDAASLAKLVRATLEDQGVQVRPLAQVVQAQSR